MIDDQEFPYLTLFHEADYNIEKWSDVEDLDALEQGRFDIILLDLKGVGTQHSNEQGLGILKHMRETNPAQIVIAYSQENWPLQHQPFFQMADFTLAKGADYIDFKRAVDRLLDLRFSKGFYIGQIERELGHDASHLARLDRRVDRALRTRDTTSLERYLRKHIHEEVTVERVLMIVQSGLQAAQLWTS